MWFSLCQRPPSAGGSLGQNPGPLGGDVVLCGCVVWWVAKLPEEGDGGDPADLRARLSCRI